MAPQQYLDKWIPGPRQEARPEMTSKLFENELSLR